MSPRLSEKYSDTAMALLKANLGFYSSTVPTDIELYLIRLLEYAFDDFHAMGCPLTPGALKDDMDQMVFAAWMYRSGVNGSGKNEMLKSIIRNRQIANSLADREEDT